jgi:hypothetical protein
MPPFANRRPWRLPRLDDDEGLVIAVKMGGGSEAHRTCSDHGNRQLRHDNVSLMARWP